MTGAVRCGRETPIGHPCRCRVVPAHVTREKNDDTAERMINDMTVRGLAENAKKSYLASVKGLARHYRRSPDQISAQEVQDYLIHCTNNGG